MRLKLLEFAQEISTIMYVGGTLSHIVIDIILGHEDALSQWNRDKAKAAIQRYLKDSKADIIIALGVLSSSVAPELKLKLQKPLIAATVIDAKQQGFSVTELGTSSMHNLHYIPSNIDLLTELKRFQKATNASHMGMLVDGNIVSAIPVVSENFENMTSQLDFKLSLIEWSAGDAQALVKKLPASLDALFLLPQSRYDTQRKAFIDMLIAKKMPTFTTMGRSEVEAGFLMGVGIIPAPKQLARQLALDVRDIALGRRAEDLRVGLQVKDRLALNQKTAKAIGYEVPFSIFSEADIVSPLSEDGRVLTLASAVEESLKRNLNIAIAKEDFDSTRQDTRIARSSLLPQVKGNLSLDAHDRDLVGSGATRSTSAGLSLSQTLYSESSLSQHTANKYLEQAQEASFSQTRLDVIQQTLEAYLRLLVAKTELNIQRDNLKLTRANLERATFRYEVGSTDRSEILRFETELNNGLQSVSNAQSAYQQAKHALNRILHRPIEETVQTREPSLDDQKVFGDKRLDAFISSPGKLKIFRNFLAEQSLKNAPELDSLASQIKAQERLLLAAKRKRYVPDVNLVGSVDRTLDDHGAQIPANHDEDWTIGLQLSLPLYQGGRISAEKAQANTQLRRLQLIHKQMKDTIEATARNSVAKAGASHRNIAYAQAAEKAAEKTLNLVTDSYVRGATNYIDLIDAQNAFLVARLSAANAIYQHLLDLSVLQRAIGFFDFSVSPEQADAWFAALNAYALTYGEKHDE